MNYDQVLALLHLGLPPGADEQAIKHAYAKRLNDCSPETDAEAWMQLHNAYKIVLSSLTDAKDPPSFDCIVELPPLNSPEHLFAAENEDGKSEFDELFDEMENLAEFARQQEEQRKKEYEAAMQAVRDEQERRCKEAEKREVAKKERKRKIKTWGWAAFFFLMAALYIPDLFPSDTVLVQRAKISGGTMTVLECIHAFTYSDGVWTASGDTVSVTAGDGDRSIKAVFTLDNTSSNAAFPMAFYSERNGKTKPVYVISFQIGSYECQGMDDLADFITDVSIQNQGLWPVKIPWKQGPGTGFGDSGWDPRQKAKHHNAEKEETAMGKIIGIDLGTTNSLAAYWNGKQCVLIPNRSGEYLTPSVVNVEEDGTFSVGKLAKEMQLTAPERCASAFKRGMGMNNCYPLGDRTFTAEELSALVLKSLKEDAEAFLGEPVEEAVISVPAYFGDKARRATRKAGVIAGLKVERIVNEPSAAALCFRHLHNGIDGNLLVFDFGGGTLDVSLVDCFENIVEITAVSGDNRLGGLDFDRVLADHFCRQHNVFFENLLLTTQQQILRAAEQAKRMLTVASKVEMKVSSEELSGEWSITRPELIRISAPIFERMRKPVQRVLMDGKINANNLTGVVLVGGSCKMPVVQDYVRYLLRGAQIETFHPDMVVAMGSGIYAGIKEKRGEFTDLILTDICPFSLGTNIINKANPGQDLMSVIIPRNSALPTSKKGLFCSVADNQTEMRLGIYQGEDMYVNNNTKLDELRIRNLPPKPAGEESVELRYSYDINGILLVDAKVISTGEERHLILGVEDDSEETRTQIEMLKKLRIDPREDEETKILLQQAESIYQQLADQDVRKELAAQIERFEQQLAANPVQAKKEAAALANLLEKLGREYFAFFQIPDKYMESFLDWYEDQQKDYYDQGWCPRD